jgi:hypothetical protein
MYKKIKIRLFLLIFVGMVACQQPSGSKSTKTRDVWTKEHANEWYKTKPWMAGCNFIPSTAVNQLEMWQAETFDTATLNRELGFAQSIGFNTVRVFLHHLAWEVDPVGFKTRVGQYLAIADKHGVSTIFVFFDDCWNATYKAGKQPDPKTGVHNSGWLRDPGDLYFLNDSLNDVLEKYVKDVLTTFANDKRIVAWDLYNEPGNTGHGVVSMPLLKKVFQWARTINPSQPLTSGIWNIQLKEINKYQLENSDVISYHNYDNEIIHKKSIDSLRVYGKPLICTEYMARRNNSRFINILPLLKKENVGAINWGFVAGKTNTIYAWDTPIPDGSEPKLWFHDIFRKNGTPFLKEEIDLIKSLTGKN